MSLLNIVKRSVARPTLPILLLPLLMVLSPGCETFQSSSTNVSGATASSGTSEVLSPELMNVGDRVRVIITDIPSPPPAIDMQIPDSGNLVLHLNQEFLFAGRKKTELEREIQQHYRSKGFYNNVVVNIEVLPRPVNVGGQVRNPGTLQHHSQMTLTRAIDGVGGLTDFANKRNITVTRLNGKKEQVNYNRALRDPSADIKILPGDQIFVRRTVW